ncbi:hypothetical protein BD626DRAFT_183535 [Schizophyllum amplum]|uniref:Uncharacterized protein n=1 Tax=Schizophyllum amplum TaxID=97359 RepID=A0A550C140_9AGAR|nr:hypothetical protein BD626DRAFT_183535 [Auriculariopsis ampla]
MSVSPSGTTMSGSPTGSMSQGAGFSSPSSSPETTGYTGGGAGFSSDMGYSMGAPRQRLRMTAHRHPPSLVVGSSPSEGNGETTLDSTGNTPATTDMSDSPSAGTSASQSGASPSSDMFVSPSGDAAGSPSASQSSPTAPTVPLPTHMIGGRDGSPEPASAPYCSPLSPESAYGPGSICYSTGIVDRALPHTSGVITLREQPTRTVYPFTTQSVVPSTWDELPSGWMLANHFLVQYVPALTGPGWKARVP